VGAFTGMKGQALLVVVGAVSSMPLLTNIGVSVPGLEISFTDVLFLVAGFILVISFLSGGKSSFLLPKIEIVFIVLCLVYVVARIFSIRHTMMPEVAWLGFRQVLGRVIVAVVIIRAVKDIKDINTLLFAILIGAALSILVSLFKLAGLIPLAFPYVGRAATAMQDALLELEGRNLGLFYTSGKFAMWHSFSVVYSLFFLLFSNRSGSRVLVF